MGRAHAEAAAAGATGAREPSQRTPKIKLTSARAVPISATTRATSIAYAIDRRMVEKEWEACARVCAGRMGGGAE